MTHAQNLALRAHYNTNPELMQQEFAVWTKVTFKLPVVPCRMTLSRVLKGPVSDAASNPERKTHHRVSSADLEERLLLWIRQCEQYKLPVVTGATVRVKADKIRHELVSSSTPEEAAKLKALVFSSDWLSKFQGRHRLTSKRTHREVASVSFTAVERGRAELQGITRSYERHNIFNMDETAFFYCATPTKIISMERMAGRKQQKKRLTMAVCCNADASTKVPLLFVGAVRKPRYFKRRSAEQLGLQCECTTKGWMTSQLFQHWLSQFNEQMRAECRRVLLLVDNVSSHRLDSTLSNVELRMLSSNTTAFLQLQDTSITSAFKALIRKIQHRHVVDRFDDVLRGVPEVGEKDTDALFNVDVLVAMRWAEAAWSKVTRATMSHCWRHTHAHDEDIYKLVESFDRL